jgi:hypothetical protein
MCTGEMSNTSTGGAGATMKGAEAKNFGVLYTGYLDKRQPTYLQTRYKTRFVVLTQDAVHWFKRDEGYDLFGEERGQVSLSNINSVRILDEDNEEFELKSNGNVCRYFRASSKEACEEWVSAIKSCEFKVTLFSVQNPSTNFHSYFTCVHDIHTLTGTKAMSDGDISADGGKKMKRNSLSNIRAFFGDNYEDERMQREREIEISVLLVSLKPSNSERETVLARNPAWRRLINIPELKHGQYFICSLPFFCNRCSP